MGFPAQLSAGQLTQLRTTNQASQKYLLLCPNDVIWQTQADEDISNTPFAEFLWSGTVAGDSADVLEGMTVIISSDSDYRTNAIFRGRVRTTPDGTTFYINENSTTLSTGDYVTVLNDWDIHERLERRTTAGTKYKDWDLTFQTLPPLITGLQSTYVDTAGTATVNFVFTATADPTANGATISTYSWFVDDGTINSGAGTASIDVDFPGAATNEHRWVVLTVTDSNGVSAYFAFEVYTVDLTDTSTNVIALDSGDYQVTGTLVDGFILTVRAWDGFSTVLDRTRCTLLSVDDYDGTATPLTQNIAFVGRLRQGTDTTAGNERYGVLQDVSLTVEGFIAQLGRLHGAGLYIETASSPDEWGEIESLTIKRTLVYMLAWHSTFLNVSGVTFDADSDDYRWPDFVVRESSILEWVNSVSDDQNAQLVIAADGQSTFQRSARIVGVSGLTTIGTLVVDDSGNSDILNFSLAIEPIPSHSQAIIGAATYNTSTATTNVYRGRAPAQSFSPGWETGTLNSQIMKANLTDAQARTETGTRIANYLETVNPRPVLTLELMPGWYWLVPTAHQLYAFTIAAADNVTGRAYSSSDKWLCTEVNYSHNTERGYDTVTATFELIVAGGTSGIIVTLVPDVNDLNVPILPGIGAGFGAIDPLINYPIDDPNFTLPGIDAGINQPGITATQPPPGCEALNVSMKTGSVVTTSESTVFGANYVIKVAGDGLVGTTSWSATFDFTQSDCGFTYVSGRALYVAGNGWRTTNWTEPTGPTDNTRCLLSFAFTGSVTVATASMTLSSYTSGGGIPAGNWAIVFGGNYGNPLATAAQAGAGTFAKTYNQLYTGSFGAAIDVRTSTGGFGGSATVSKLVLTGSGSVPVEIQSNATNFTGGGSRGDAFYTGYDDDSDSIALYPGSNGFQVDAARPGGLPTFQSSHAYSFSATGTGSPLGFRFLDSDYSDNDNNQLTVLICGEGMKQA
jgi:hypothetical protein